MLLTIRDDADIKPDGAISGACHLEGGLNLFTYCYPVGKVRIPQQVRHGLTQILRDVESKQVVSGIIEPGQMIVLIDHQGGIRECIGHAEKFLNDGLVFLLLLAVGLLQFMYSVENIRPHAEALRNLPFLASEPLVKPKNIGHRPRQVAKTRHRQNQNGFPAQPSGEQDTREADHQVTGVAPPVSGGHRV